MVFEAFHLLWIHCSVFIWQMVILTPISWTMKTQLDLVQVLRMRFLRLPGGIAHFGLWTHQQRVLTRSSKARIKWAQELQIYRHLTAHCATLFLEKQKQTSSQTGDPWQTKVQIPPSPTCWTRELYYGLLQVMGETFLNWMRNDSWQCIAKAHPRKSATSCRQLSGL